MVSLVFLVCNCSRTGDSPEEYYAAPSFWDHGRLCPVSGDPAIERAFTEALGFRYNTRQFHTRGPLNFASGVHPGNNAFCVLYTPYEIRQFTYPMDNCICSFYNSGPGIKRQCRYYAFSPVGPSGNSLADFQYIFFPGIFHTEIRKHFSKTRSIITV